ncbi:metallophosphoesterase family protein, partial [Winogradskyella sp.]|nr:metallophosphoesterase family protein [Winogradskyella sp.]
MKKNLQLTFLLLLTVLLGYSNTDKYRLVITDDPSTTITIAWNQISGTNPIVHYDTVDYGTNDLLYNFTKGVDRVISYRGMDNRFVRLTGLTPNTNYYFIIKDSNDTSQRFWFKTTPNDTSRLSFIAGGDSRNNRTPRRNANKLVAKLKPHAVLFGGDMTDDNTTAEWLDWFDDWQLTTASDGRMFPIVPTRGNHEYDPNTIYNLFDTTNTNSYYAITFGDNLIRTYTLNSEISVLGDQLTWLQGDLASSSNLTWKMAQYHKPMRPHTAWKTENNNQYNAWAQLFYDQGVRLVVDCDSHMAKTTWPVKPSSGDSNDEGFVIEQTNGTVYTGEGCWGAPLRPSDDDKSWTRNSGSFNQFKLIFVDANKIELRTIRVNNADLVGEVSNTDPFTLPVNLDVFSPPTGDVVTISNMVDTNCPAAGSPCDDNNTNTIFDEEDGNCNCVGLLATDLTESSIEVNVSSDDAEEVVSTGAVSITSTDLELVVDAENQVIGVRFNNVEIPDGATLYRAYIQFQTDETDSSLDPTNLLIHGELSPSSATFTTNTSNISSRALTINSETWNDINIWDAIGEAGLDQRTPYVTDIVNEIITQPTWVFGNSVTFIFSGTGKRVARSFNSGQPPILKLFYDSNCPINNVTIGSLGACSAINDTYSQDIIVEYSDAPATGNLIVNGQSFIIGTSPQTVTLTGLAADGLEVDITANFSDNTECFYSQESAFEAPSACSNNGLPDNEPDATINLALLNEAVLTENISGGRGSIQEILYDPLLNNYRTVTQFNEFGIGFNQNIGTPTINEGIKLQFNWPNVKYINYITFGGVYTTNNNVQAQPNTLWQISYRVDGNWFVHEQGQGGWIDGGIYEWGGPTENPIEADALRLQLYSDGINDLVSTHLRGRGGSSDSATTTKATLIQYLSPGNSCGVTIPSGTMLYCDGSWISGDGPTATTDTTNIIIADGTYTVPADISIEVNTIEVSNGASLIIEQGG